MPPIKTGNTQIVSIANHLFFGDLRKAVVQHVLLAKEVAPQRAGHPEATPLPDPNGASENNKTKTKTSKNESARTKNRCYVLHTA